jgi:UDP-N-acetylglucosamine 2-epimerase (non-hydrolysing)
MKRIEPVLVQEKPVALIVVGDVNSTAAAALVAKKLEIEVVHVEAGLRSFDRSMPEEINRIVTDSICDVFLVTEESGRVNLLREGVAPERIYFVGNLMIDSLRQNVERARQSDIAGRLGIGGMNYGVVTLHRPANVDDPGALEEIMGALRVIAENTPLFWPVHPRTRARLEGGSLPLPREMRLLEPLGYLDFLSLEAGASLVLTDSGGIQEETTVLGVNCLTLRDNTERPVTIELGTNRLAGTKKASILAAWDELRNSTRPAQIPPLWDGKAGERSREVLRQLYVARAKEDAAESLRAHARSG